MRLFLNGGGDGAVVAGARARLNEVIDHSKKILYIPLAWPDDSFSGCFEFITEELRDIESAGIEMVTSGCELAAKNYSEYAFLYIGGGNTYKLLGTLKESGSFEKIRDYLMNQDGIVFGGSAGAIIFGKDLDSCKTDDANEVGLLEHTGFDMLSGYSLLCHFTNRDETRTRASREYLLELSKIKPVYALPEEDTIIVEQGKLEVIGSRLYYEFVDGEMRERVPCKLKNSKC